MTNTEVTAMSSGVISTGRVRYQHDYQSYLTDPLGKTFVYPFSIILTIKKNRKIFFTKLIEKSLTLSSSL